jgi:MoaA/NifB/PqqE/SkfB family radical SAM enzyme
MDCSSVIARPVSLAGGALAEPLTRLPLATLYLTERCNSRCVSCDYWRHGRRDIDLDTVQRLLPGLASLGTQTVLVSGGEPLLHPHWAEIAALLRGSGIKLWLLTAGLALAKHAVDVARLFDQVTVSLDGSTASSYAAIRGLDAFEAVCAGIRAAVREGVPVGLRVTVQRGNAGELGEQVELARRLGVEGISFLAADIGHVEAFGRWRCASASRPAHAGQGAGRTGT